MLISLAAILLITETLASSLPAVRNGINPGRRSARRVLNEPRRRTIYSRYTEVLTPKLFIISMFDSEADIWYEDTDLDLLAQNITIPGFSPLFPDAHCNPTGEVCQLTTGEGEINAAATVQALWLSSAFNLTSTYFLIAGISGINPHMATTGSVTFSRYAVQFDLQYEFSERQIPSNDSSGWFPMDSDYPDETNAFDYPGAIYGTEVFELNDDLRQRAVYLAGLAQLNDSAAAQAYRDNYPYAPANQPPAVVQCDSGTSNNYWSGSVIGDAYSAYTTLLTNGSGVYCGTQQEDNATLEALLRGALAGTLDFARIILMRTASDFDRAPPTESETYHLLYAQQEGFDISIQNIYNAGIIIVRDILLYWDGTYLGGLRPGNYIGDILDSLGGPIVPDIGTPAVWLF